MSKYTVEVKLQAVACYLTRNESYKTIAESIDADKSLLINWVKLFEAQVERGFKKGYTSYCIGCNKGSLRGNLKCSANRIGYNYIEKQ